MVLPAFVNVGATRYSANPLVIDYPASVAAGNLILLLVHQKSANPLPNALSLPSGDWFSMFEDLHDNGLSPRQRLSVAGKWADGSESGTLSINAPDSTGAGAHGVMMQFSGVGRTGSAPQIEGAAAKVENHSGAGTYTPPDLVTTGADRLGVLLAGWTDDNSVPDSAGLTGWTKRFQTYNNALANDYCTAGSTATRLTAGTLVSGAISAAQLCQFRVFAFYNRPSGGAQAVIVR